MVYTAIAGSYDRLHIPKRPWDARYVAFVDKPERSHIGPWELRPHPRVLATSRRTAKYPKVMAHAVFPQATHSLWMDGNIAAVRGVQLKNLIAKFLDGADIALLRHPERDCLYAEAFACMAWNLDPPDVIFRQVAGYEREGYPAGAGLAEAGAILRRHTPAVEKLNEAWWDEIGRGSSRDQISFPYVVWKLGAKYNCMPARETEGARFVLTHRRHLRPRLPDPAPEG